MMILNQLNQEKKYNLNRQEKLLKIHSLETPVDDNNYNSFKPIIPKGTLIKFDG